jgi:UDP-N-acetylmuramoylalanine--D-glutamate ligase
MELKGKTVRVIGLGESGLAMVKWLAREGARVLLADSRPLERLSANLAAVRAVLPEAECLCGEFTPALYEGVDLLAVSPGVDRRELPPSEVPQVSEIELFAWAIRRLTPAAKVIAITGSNGKTTTTALTGALAEAAGKRVGVAGNISPAALDALMAAQDAGSLPELWVLELSSFQLETTASLNAEAAAVLNVSEDHLDRYSGMDDYAAAKARVFEGNGVQVVNRDDARTLAMRRFGRRVVSFGLDAPRGDDYGVVDGWLVRGEQRLLALADMQLTGLHNAANALAALALLEAVGIAPAAVLPALAAFKGLAHRVEFVREVGGVTYYDDSKGTNVGATLAAITGLGGLGKRLWLIAGGDGKGQDFGPLAAACAAHVGGVALIGRDAPAIAAVLVDLPSERCADMDAAVRWCAAQAQPGEVVLLSPACASLDMYKNYAHRAEVFIAAVQALAGAEEGA